MAFNWTITSLTVSQEPQPNTVVAIEYEAALGEVKRQGRVTLSPPGEAFTSYDALTPEVVLGWLWEYVSKDATEAALSAQAGAAPAALPWASSGVQD